MKHTVVYDYHEGQEVPIWFVINVENEDIDWDTTFLFNVDAPFQKRDINDFDELSMSLAIYLEDLTIPSNSNKPLGINLPVVKLRVEAIETDVQDIKQFVLQVSDIEDMLQLQS